MVHWERLSNWSSTSQANISGVWACKVIKSGTPYYLYFSAIMPTGGKRVVYVATSANVENNFTGSKPLPWWNCRRITQSIRVRSWIR